MYLFPKPSVTKYFKLAGLKQQKFIISLFWRLEVKILAKPCFLWNLSGESFLPFWTSGVLPAVIGNLAYRRTTLIPYLPARVCLCDRISPFYKDTSRIELETILLINLINFLKSLFQTMSLYDTLGVLNISSFQGHIGTRDRWNVQCKKFYSGTNSRISW